MFVSLKETIGGFIIAGVAGFFFAATAAASTTTAPLFPSGDGAFLAWTPKSGTVHYTAVDESFCNGTTDYVAEVSLGERDSYVVSLATIPNGATITNIALTPCAARNSTGSGRSLLNLFYRYNGVQSADAGLYVLPATTTPFSLATTNFSGLSLGKNSSSSLEVGAVYASGTKGVRLSQLATVITYTPLTTPAAPTNLSGTVLGTTSIGLSWSDNSNNETGFSIERSTNAGVFTEIATTSANVTTVTNFVSATGTYYYRVRAFNGAGYSAYSATSTVTIPPTPAAPSNLSATATTSKNVILAWSDNSSNETGFFVERSVMGGTFGIVASTSPNTTAFRDRVITPGTYYYRVRSFNSFGFSPYSNIRSIIVR